MKKISILIAAVLVAVSAYATPGNNGGGNGGCGVGQQTNGCGTPIPGPQGPVGPQGPAGRDGVDGINGTNGTNGLNGKDGVNGIDGKDGATGPAGLNGKDGTNGVDGAAGVAGADGKDGLNGKDGADGVNGKDGVGLAGKDGKDGETIAGKDGAPGEKGLNGSDATVPADVVRQAALKDATQKMNSRLDSMQGQIDRNDRRSAAGASAAIAFASMPQTIDPGSISLTAGVGTYDSEAGAAIGISGRDASGDFTWKAGVTVGSRGTAGVGAGAAWRFK